MNGTIHTDRHIAVLARRDAFMTRPVWVTTNRVAILMASTEKSVAWTESWPSQPLKAHAGLAESCW